MSREECVDVAVVGAGLVGLATALQLLRRHPGASILVLEKEQLVAAHQSGRNSGVVHRGLYYRPESAKARLCAAGARALLDFCDRRGVPYALVGKLIVATRAAELAALRELQRRGEAAGVPDLAWIERERLAEIEPHASGLAALHSPKTGIVDFRAVAAAYAECLRAAGGTLVTGARLVGVERRADRLHLETTAGTFAAAGLVNCAGLYADVVAALSGTPVDVRVIPFRGEYWKLRPAAEHLVAGLIYPVPDPRFPFLGSHFTRRLAGGVEAGPNAVLALAREGYTRAAFVPREALGTLAWPGFWRLALRTARTGLAEELRSWSTRATAAPLRRLVPELRAADLLPAAAGVRAQAVDRQGRLLDDFVILEAERAVHVLNAPSPAATASLAIGAEVAARAARVLDLGRPVTEELVPVG